MKEALSSIVFLAIAGAALWGWNQWQLKTQDAKETRPSIGDLASSTVSVPVETPSGDAAQADASSDTRQETTPVVAVPAPAELIVKVMNGGAAKGSAAKVQDFLKKNGYAKAEALSATGNYTGTTVYYSGSDASSATAVQKLLVKDYPTVQVKAATSSKAEDGSAPVVVMLGK